MTISAAVTPGEWLRSLGAFLNDFYEAQCKAVKASVEAAKKSKEVTNNSKLQISTVKRAPPSTIQKSTRRSSLTLSTPLKDKDSSPINLTLTTPKPTASNLSSTPFTEGRSRRTAATKADKYIDIVSRRLAEVPANGSTPKSMKIASKLISEATPNSRRTILLSQTLTNKSEVSHKPTESVPQSTPNKPNPLEIPAATPASVRKRKRAAKIHQMFETPLISLAAAASTDIGSLSPAGISVAPSTISKTRLNQSNIAEEPIKRVSPVKKSASPPVKLQKISPIKRSETPPIKSQRVSPQTKAQKISPQAAQAKTQHVSPVRISPVKRSQRVSPVRGLSVPAQMPTVAATPKAPVVEFVAPQSVLRSSKRPRKPIDTSIYSEDASNVASPAMKKQAKFTDVPNFPTVSIESQSQVKIVPQTPVTVNLTTTVPVAPIIPISAKVSNVPAIIIPLSAAKTTEEASSNEDLPALASSSKRTPLRVQSSRTPTRTKSAIPSLSDYSAAAKIAVIEVAKNSNANNNVALASTPKVEPWTSKFIQKESATATIVAAPSVNLSKAALNINIKPVDTSKISGFSSSSGTTAVPVVPRFPLNLANISNITKPSATLLKPAEPLAPSNVSTTSSSTNVTESPLSRAKRIDSENSSREERLKLMKTKSADVDKPKEAVLESKAMETTLKINEAVLSAPINKNTVTENVQLSSKLPVKPKSSTTVLPSPKIPSRLAEAFSGIDSELPPIDIGLVDDEKILKNILNSNGDGFINPKMKKQPGTLSTTTNNTINTPSIVNSETATNSQLHRTAVLNSAARKVNAAPEIKDKQPPSTANAKQPQQQQPLPSTPKPQASSTKLDTSSPSFPEILSDDELDKREKMQGKENRPTWAMTPNLTVALNAQRSQRAEDVFGKVQPIKLEDFFKGSGKKFPNRSSTSNWNNNI